MKNRKKPTLVKEAPKQPEQQENQSCCPMHEMMHKYGMTEKDLTIMLNCLANNEFTATSVIFTIHQVNQEDGEALLEAFRARVVQEQIEQMLPTGTQLN